MNPSDTVRNGHLCVQTLAAAQWQSSMSPSLRQMEEVAGGSACYWGTPLHDFVRWPHKPPSQCMPRTRALSLAPSSSAHVASSD